MSFPVLWSGLVSWVGASHWANIIAPFLLGQNCPRKMTMTMTYIRAFSRRQTFSKDDGDRLQRLPETTNDFRQYSAHVRDVRSPSSTPRRSGIKFPFSACLPRVKLLTRKMVYMWLMVVGLRLERSRPTPPPSPPRPKPRVT